MPIAITTYPANAKPIAETEEFKELLKQVAQSQSLLNQISSQIVAIKQK